MVPPRFLRCLIPLLLSLQPAEAGEANQLLGEGDYGKFAVVGSEVEKVRLAVEPLGELGAKSVLRIETREACGSPYAAQLTTRNGKDIRKGDVLLLHFYLRTVKSDLESQEGITEVVVEDAESYDKSLQFAATALKEWKEHVVPFVAGSDFPAGRAAINFRVGYGPQIIEIAGLSLRNFGGREKLDEYAAGRVRLAYEGMEADAPWRAAAAERIEKHRKAELRVSVVDEAGRPVEGAAVAVNQTGHAYWFGSAVRVDHLVRPDQPEPENAYRRQVVELFNMVTFENDLKWPFWQRNFPATEAAVAWLNEEGIALRGHALVWGSRKKGLPESLYGLIDDPARLEKAILNHIAEVTGKVKPPAAAWDVLNEAFNHHEFMDVLGEGAMVEWFQAARKGSPGSRLFINDWGIITSRGLDLKHQDAYAKTISFLLERKAPLDGIGMQGHFGRELTTPEQMLRVLDRFGEFGREIQMTEYSSQFANGEDAAAYLRDCLTVFFSHPATSGFILWGFREGVGMPHKGHLLDKDGNETESGRVWRDLIFHQWWTRADMTSGGDGSARVRGFLGNYRVRAVKDGREGEVVAELREEGGDVKIVLGRPAGGKRE